MVTTTRACVLIVSQDQTLVQRLAAQCRRDRLSAERAGSVSEAAAVVRGNGADVVVVDLALPDEDGFEVVRRLRLESEVPLVLLSEDAAWAAEEVGLALGADDFISRRVSPRLFVARLKALLRRTRQPAERTLLRLGPLQLDAVQLRATVDGQEMGLTLAELRLFEALLRVPGNVLTRRRLLEATGSGPATSERTVDVHVANLRRKLAPYGLEGMVQTVRGVGYRLRWPLRRAAVRPARSLPARRDTGP